MKNETNLQLEKNNLADKYDEVIKMGASRVLVILIFILSVFAAFIRALRGENIVDIVMIFCGSVGVQQFYMFLKTRNIAHHLIISFILLSAAIFSCIKLFVI